MNQKTTLNFVTFASLLLFGCAKNNMIPGMNNPISFASQWTIKGITYKPVSTQWDGNSLNGTDSKGNSIQVEFLTTPSHLVEGAYIVTGGIPSNSNPGAYQCNIIIVQNAGGADLYSSIGTPGDQVILTNSEGKWAALFTNVSFSNGTTATASGTLIQQ